MIIAALPLRLASTRIPQKVLHPIRGQSLVRRSFARASQAFAQDANVKVIAVVDDVRVEAEIKKYFPQASVVLTDPEIPSGTDRVFAGVRIYLEQNKIPQANVQGVINIQGDMPFMGAEGLHQIAKYLEINSQKRVMLTLAQAWPADQPLSDVGAVKVISDREGRAIYFSRFAIPYSRLTVEEVGPQAEMHIGVYGFTLDSLAEFCAQSATPLERAESLEQLRALWLGIPLQVLNTQVEPQSSYRGIDLPSDLEWAENFSAS